MITGSGWTPIARKKGGKDKASHANWATSYTDLLSQLLIFFIAMAAASKVQQQKAAEIERSVVGTQQYQGRATSSKTASNEIQSEVRKALKQNKIEDKVELMADLDGAVVLAIQDKFLFRSSEAGIDSRTAKTFATVLAVIKKLPNTYSFDIEGHTDDRPIKTSDFENNWELSAARALSVLKLFIQNGVDPSRISVRGYADQRPLFPKPDDQHSQSLDALENWRARNRVVAIRIH